MIIPSGATVIFKGGSFEGDISGGNIELSDGVLFVGTVNQTPVKFNGNFTLPSGSLMEIQNSNVEFSNLTALGNLSFVSSVVEGTSFVVNGTASSSGNSDFNIASINGSGTVDLTGRNFSGTTWITSLVSSTGKVEIESLTTSSLIIQQTELSEITNLSVSSALTINARLVLNSITTSSGCVITVNGPNSFVTVKSLATFSSTAIAGNGRFALYSGADQTNLSAGSNIKICEYGAGITAFSLENKTNTTALASTARTDDSKTYLIEKRLGSETDYSTVDLDCNEDEVTLTTTYGSPNVVRVFDGVSFFSDVAYVADLSGQQSSVSSNYYVYTLGNYSFNNSIRPFRNEPLVFLGSVINSDTGNQIKRSEVSSVKINVYKYGNYSYSSTSASLIPRWTNVSIDKKCFFENAKAFDIWDKGGTCNFCWIPNQNTESFTSDSGKYSAVFNAELISGTNIMFSLEFEVI